MGPQSVKVLDERPMTHAFSTPPFKGFCFVLEAETEHLFSASNVALDGLRMESAADPSASKASQCNLSYAGGFNKQNCFVLFFSSRHPKPLINTFQIECGLRREQKPDVKDT